MTDAPSGPTPNAAPASGGKKWLYASIALNLLLVGVLVGSHAFERPHKRKMMMVQGPPPMAMRDVGFAFMKSLPDERRAELFKSSRARFDEAKPYFEESIKLRKAAFAMLEQDTIDPAELKAAFAKMRTADAEAQARAGEAFADMVAKLPAAERKAAVAKVRERWAAREAQRMGPGHWGLRNGPPPTEGGPPPPDGFGSGGPPPPPPPGQ
ncbi:MAG: periplasmic heavy metal sensor [Caulobacterales bacterium]